MPLGTRQASLCSVVLVAENARPCRMPSICSSVLLIVCVFVLVSHEIVLVRPSQRWKSVLE